jgi:L-ascorbate metabolism protein UlaG (beta-lactamase superfamily)
LCIAHLGHLHHTLTQSHLAELAAVDVVMVPIDGAWTLNQAEMIEVLQQIRPKIIIPMHIFTRTTLDRFLTRIDGLYVVRNTSSRTVVFSRSELPEKAEILILPGV